MNPNSGFLLGTRILESVMAEQVLSKGMATRADLERINAGWRRWVESPDRWFSILHGEVLCRVRR